MTHRENYLRNATLSGPEWMPVSISITPSAWKHLREEAEDVCLRHPTIWPGFRKGQRDFDAMPERFGAGAFVDSWGCRWDNAVDGVVGVVAGHPLDRYDRLGEYVPPDPARFDHLTPIDWAGCEAALRRHKESGALTSGVLTHGFQFMRLYYLRGMENFMIDVATDEPRLNDLVAMVEQFNTYYVQRYLELGIDVLHCGDDLGAQDRSLLSASQFAKWIAPSYKRLMRPCREAGMQVFLHSDGHIMEIMDQLLNRGVSIINPQDLANGVDNLAREVKGRVCIRLDIDRQSVVPFGTPQQIDAHLEECVRKLGSPAGGLELQCAILAPTPPENLDAVATAMEKWRGYWFESGAR